MAKVLLKDIAVISAGNSAPQDEKLFINGVYPFCRTSDVGRVHIAKDFTDIKDRLNDDGVKKLKLFKKNTILFPKSGASTFLNHRVMLGVDSYVSSHLATIYADGKKVLPDYLFYLLQKIDSRDLAPDSGYPSLNLKSIEKIELNLPAIEEQEKIVEKLDAEFEKISKAEKLLKENLENVDKLQKAILSEAFDVESDTHTHRFEDIVISVKIPTKIQRKQYLKSGLLPIVSQEDGEINGYWDNEKDKIEVTKPLIVWGDHTRIIKFVDYDFVAGADGAKVFLPKDNIQTKWLYYWMCANPVKSLGYARHFRVLKEEEVKVPSIDIQNKCIEKLDLQIGEINKIKEKIAIELGDFSSLRNGVLDEAFAL